MRLNALTRVSEEFFYEVLEIYKDEIKKIDNAEAYSFKGKGGGLLMWKSFLTDNYYIEGAGCAINITELGL